jgi:hypothetical protein
MNDKGIYPNEEAAEFKTNIEGWVQVGRLDNQV